MKRAHTPPRWIDSILEKLAPQHLAEEIKGDLYEMFIKDVKSRGLRFARRKYVQNGIGFFVKQFFWKENTPETSTNNLTMLSSYLKMAYRSLLFYKSNTIVNIVGLVIGIATSLIILTQVHFELSFDSFHSDRERIYRLIRVTGKEPKLNDESECRTGISYAVPPALKEGIPSLENITSMFYFTGIQINAPGKNGVEQKYREELGCAMVEPSFFRIFDFNNTSFRWIAGNPETALQEPYNIVLTRSLADKYFPQGNALGSALRIEKEFEGRVTGVIEDLPSNTDLPFSMLVSYSTLRKVMGNKMDNWSSVDDDHTTFLKLAPGIDPAAIEKQIAKIHQANTPKDIHEFRHYLLQPLSDVHNDTRFGNYNGRTISKQTLLALELIALFLLLTASINYINLSTAQSALRYKEIGLRKVMGSNRSNLLFQFMTETFLIVLLAGIAALILAEIALPNLQTLLNLKMTGFLFMDPFVVWSLILIIIFVTVFSGFYPSLVISRLNPIGSLRSSFSTQIIGGISLRKFLVVTQFTITQILVVGTFIVVSQMRFFQDRDMGFNRDSIITLAIPERNSEKLDAFRNQLHAQSFVSGVSFSSTFPSGLNRRRSYTDIGRMEAHEDKDFQIFELQFVDPDYLDVYKIKLLGGRTLTLQDTVRGILINKNLATKLDLGSPEEAIGKDLKFNGNKVTVVGVMDDFYSNSLKEGAGNVGMLINPKRYRGAGIKLKLTEDGENITEAVQRIEKIWSSLYPETVFEFQFLDKSVQAFYAQEQKYAKLFQLFSTIFLLIGCLGLYGLIAFVVNRKSKEVAIRKVLGAKLSNVLIMFSREYVQLILVSFICAVPIAWYGVNSWLSNFAQHIPLQWWLFVLPGIMVLLLAIVVIVTKSFRAANANPVEALRND